MSNLTHTKYPFLKECGIEAENKGCFNGKEWVANGNVVTSYNPTTGEAIATVREGSKADYEQTAANMEAAKE